MMRNVHSTEKIKMATGTDPWRGILNIIPPLTPRAENKRSKMREFRTATYPGAWSPPFCSFRDGVGRKGFGLDFACHMELGPDFVLEVGGGRTDRKTL